MVTTAGPAPKRRRRAETRERLVKAALGVFARNGYERATVDEIVREAGYSKGAFYVHFEAKEDIFWAMLEERLAQQQEAFREALDIDVPVAQNLQTILRSLFALNQNEPLWSALFMEFVAHAARNGKVRDKLAAMYQSWRSFAVEVLHAGQEAGKVRKDVDAEFLASVIIAMIEGSMMQSRLAPGTLDLEKMVEPLSGLLAEWLEP
jgi:TetR/AcrR family fatty acid metabolism transcriptional regulator